MAKGKGKQRKRVRKRSWNESDVDAVTREPRRVRGRETGIGAPVDQDRGDPESGFADITPNGVVVSPYGLLAFVESGGVEHLCRIDDALVDGKTSVLAPGDGVRVEFEGKAPIIREALRRKNKLSRPAVGRNREQVFAANVDLLLVVAAAAKPRFKPGLVDRFLIAGEVGGVDIALCLNKMDLVETESQRLDAYREMGLRIFPTSCFLGWGIDDLRVFLQGKVTVFAGHSGVGKSSLINVLEPELDLSTQEVSETTEKGRHTTSMSKLYHLEGDIHIIDTPGIRQLGLWKVTPEELGYYFPEMATLAAECRFRDCTHTHEPDCAVLRAVEAGDIPSRRHASYLRIRESLEEEERGEFAPGPTL